MSFNIRNMHSKDGDNSWEMRRDMVCDLIRRIEPDLIATQEAYRPQVDDIERELPDYRGVGVGRDDGDLMGEYCRIFYRRDRLHVREQGTFWFSDTPDTAGSRHWTPHHARICTWARIVEPSGQTFSIYNVHLDHESDPARRQSTLLLLERIRLQSASDPVLVTGDFNVREDDPALATLQEAEYPTLRDTFRLIHPGEQDDGTFHGFSGRADRERIDFIFASPEFQTTDASIIRDCLGGRYPSDHFPILAQLALGND